jgi:hypothetical protein
MMGEEEKKEKKEKPKKPDILDIFDLKIFGTSIMDLVTNLDEVREGVIAKRDELQRKLGDRVRVDLDFRVGNLTAGRTTTASTAWSDLIRERTEWRKKIPTLKMTKEQIREAIQELEKEKREPEEAEEKPSKEGTPKEE